MLSIKNIQCREKRSGYTKNFDNMARFKIMYIFNRKPPGLEKQVYSFHDI
jgi:hypothetical protein